MISDKLFHGSQHSDLPILIKLNVRFVSPHGLLTDLCMFLITTIHIPIVGTVIEFDLLYQDCLSITGCEKLVVDKHIHIIQ